MATLSEFLTTGRLGEIMEGASKEFVRQRLGEPEDVSVQKNPEMWKYGALQLAFQRDRGAQQASLDFMGLYFQTEFAVPKSLGWTGWFPGKHTDFKAFFEWLTAAGLDGAAQVTGEDNEYVVMNSGVRVAFDQGMLQSIQFMAPRTKNTRQLSVQIPAELWDRIRAEAGHQKISMSELCTRWITEHAKEPTEVATS